MQNTSDFVKFRPLSHGQGGG